MKLGVTSFAWVVLPTRNTYLWVAKPAGKRPERRPEWPNLYAEPAVGVQKGRWRQLGPLTMTSLVSALLLPHPDDTSPVKGEQALAMRVLVQAAEDAQCDDSRRRYDARRFLRSTAFSFWCDAVDLRQSVRERIAGIADHDD